MPATHFFKIWGSVPRISPSWRVTSFGWTTALEVKIPMGFWWKIGHVENDVHHRNDLFFKDRSWFFGGNLKGLAPAVNENSWAFDMWTVTIHNSGLFWDGWLVMAIGLNQWSTFVELPVFRLSTSDLPVVAGKFSRSYDGYNKPFETYFVATGLVLGASVLRPSLVAICIPFLSRTVQNHEFHSTIYTCPNYSHCISIMFQQDVVGLPMIFPLDSHHPHDIPL